MTVQAKHLHHIRKINKLYVVKQLTLVTELSQSQYKHHAGIMSVVNNVSACVNVSMFSIQSQQSVDTHPLLDFYFILSPCLSE